MTTPTSASAEPASAGKVPLTRDLVVTTALHLIDEGGVDALSMRRLGLVLNRDPMSLYRHTVTRGDLLDAVVELVLTELVIDPAAADWKVELRAGAHTLRRVALAHPRVVPLLVTRPLATPLGRRPAGMLRPLGAFLTLLTGHGFTPAGALSAYRMWTATVHGHLLDELQELITSPDETDALLRLGLYRLPPREFPLLRGLADELGAYDGTAQLDRELDAVLTGLTPTHRHPGRRTPAPTGDRGPPRPVVDQPLSATHRPTEPTQPCKVT